MCVPNDLARNPSTDFFVLACPHCRNGVEFFADDPIQSCSGCELTLENPFYDQEPVTIEPLPHSPRPLVTSLRVPTRYRPPVQMRLPDKWPKACFATLERGTI